MTLNYSYRQSTNTLFQVLGNIHRINISTGQEDILLSQLFFFQETSHRGYFTLSMGHLPNTFCFISPSSCFISPSNLLHFPNKSLRFPNSLLHFPNRLLHFPNTVSHFPNTILCHFAKHRIKFFSAVSLVFFAVFSCPRTALLVIRVKKILDLTKKGNDRT